MNEFGNYRWWWDCYRRTYRQLNKFRPEIDPESGRIPVMRALVTSWVIVTIILAMRYDAGVLDYMLPILAIGGSVRFLVGWIRRSW